jgi:pimeloyl-ACP methyl ester carboxylesterase
VVTRARPIPTEPRIYPAERASKLQERLPGSQLVKLPRAGHLPMLERPAETAARLVAFLREKP